MIDLKELRERAEVYARHEMQMGFSSIEVIELLDQLEAAQKQVEQYRVYDDVIAEIDRRADKEWCLGDKCDFTVTITYEQYLAINASQSTN